MSSNKKLISHFIWTFFAILIGVFVGDVLIRGGHLAYGVIHAKTQELLF